EFRRVLFRSTPPCRPSRICVSRGLSSSTATSTRLTQASIPPGCNADRSMTEQPLHEIVRQRVLVCDGAMGTQLMLAGLEQGGCGEAWNLTHPDRVRAIQQRYAEAGADCLITNTFGGSRIMLRRHGHEAELAEINRAGARIAREAFGGRPGFVLGDIGPLGALLEPYGDLSAEAAEAALVEQA